MTGILEAVLKFVSEFTWRKLIALGLVIIFCIVVLSLYERYTSSFRLSRLHRATELLIKVHDLELRPTQPGSELDRAKQALIVQAAQAIDQKPLTLDILPTTIKLSMDDLWRFVAGSIIWVVLALLQLPNINDPKRRDTLMGTILFAVFSGCVAVFTPPIWWPWFHLFIYPFLLIILIIVVAVPIGALINRFSGKNKNRESPV